MNRRVTVSKVHKTIEDAVELLQSLEWPVTEENVTLMLATQVVSLREGSWNQENADKFVADWKRSNIS